MKKLDLEKIENRNLYLETDIDTDGSLYLKQRYDIQKYCPLFVRVFFEDYERQIDKIIEERKLSWYFVIGYRLYFTYDNLKYCILFGHQSVGVKEFYVRKLVNSLRKLKCSKFYFKEGRID